MKQIIKIGSCAWLANILCEENIIISIITTFAIMTLFNIWGDIK